MDGVQSKTQAASEPECYAGDLFHCTLLSNGINWQEMECSKSSCA